MFDMTENYQFQIVTPPPFKVKFLQEKKSNCKTVNNVLFGKTRESTNRPLANPTYILLKATNGT